LKQLTKAELIDLVKRVLDEVDRLKATVSQVHSELDHLKQPPATSLKSSLSPSRDQKANPPRRAAANGVARGPACQPAAERQQQNSNRQSLIRHVPLPCG